MNRFLEYTMYIMPVRQPVWDASWDLQMRKSARVSVMQKPLPGRTNLITVGELLVVDDCYNANPVSMKASLDVLAQADGRKIAVLGDMGELGENECEMHYEVGKYAANQGVDVLFCCGTLSEELAKGAQRGHTQVMYFKTLDKMMLALVPYLRNGDTVLVKASHFMEFSKDSGGNL